MANRIKVAISSTIQTLRKQGWSLRRIARTLEVDRATVARHVRRGECESNAATNLSTGSEALPEPNAASNLSTGFPAKESGNSGPRSLCDPWRAIILEKLDQGLTAQRIWQDMVAERGFAGRYASVKRYVRRLGKVAPLPFRRMECSPGEEAQIDFGPGAPVVGSNGRHKRYPVLRVVLSHSRKAYSEALARQSTEDFIRGLENAFRHFGGVPRTLVPDNLKAAVLRADWYDPEINPKIRDFCRHYGCAILPTKSYTPRHKGKVEASVKYVSGNALKGKLFKSLQEENEALQDWEASVADLRIHGTTKRQVKALFDLERPHLLPLPAGLFPFFREAPRAVNKDAHVEVDKAYYSVPPEYLRHTVWARWDAKMVRIFNQRMEQIAIHVKGEAGRFRTDPKHIALEKIANVERGAGYLLKLVSRIGPQTTQWAQTMLDQRGIEGVRVLQGLLSMTRRHCADDLEKACQLALSHGSYRLHALRDMLRQPTRQTQFIEAHPLIRPMDFYGLYLQVSFRKENNGNDGNGEFVALRAPDGDRNGKSLEVTQALPIVQPPATALGSLSIPPGRDLSSEPAQEKVAHAPIGVKPVEAVHNHCLERIAL